MNIDLLLLYVIARPEVSNTARHNEASKKREHGKDATTMRHREQEESIVEENEAEANVSTCRLMFKKILFGC